MKKIFLILFVVVGCLIYLSATKKSDFDGLRVGVTAGPHAIILEKVRAVAKERGVNIEITEFNDFILPNEALNGKDLDINVYQHEPFLNDQVQKRGYHIAKLAPSVLMPMGMYSKKIKSLDMLQEGDQIAIPNDPTNGGRALLLLEQAKLIKLKVHDNPTILDVVENPKKLKITEVEAPQLPRTLDDVKASVINTDWVIIAKIDKNLQIFRENKQSIYTNIIAVHRDRLQDPKVRQFVGIYHSHEIREFIEKYFKGEVLPGW